MIPMGSCRSSCGWAPGASSVIFVAMNSGQPQPIVDSVVWRWVGSGMAGSSLPDPEPPVIHGWLALGRSREKWMLWEQGPPSLRLWPCSEAA